MTTILLNGQEITIETDKLTYKEIVRLAFNLDDPKYTPSVIYSRGVENASGILSPGKSVTVKDRMHIDAAFTGNA